MSPASAVIFSVAAIFYLLSWKYIRQLIREVNSRDTKSRVSIWWWQRGWKMHTQFFPRSAVRGHIAFCIALTAGLVLVAFCIEVRSRMIHH